MIQNIFLVGTQTQYLNAIEAVAAFGLKYEESLLIAPKAMRRKKGEPEEPWAQMRWYSHSGDVSNLAKLLGRKNPLGRVLRFKDHVSLFTSFVPDEAQDIRLFVDTNLDARMRHFVNSVDVGELVLLDDGAATIHLPEKLRSGKRREVRHRVVDWLLRIDTSFPGSGVVFTTYDLEVPAGWNLRKNTYAVLRNRLAGVQADAETFVIGGPYVDFGHVDLETYINWLQRIKERAMHPVVYVRHRRESASYVEAIAERVGMTTWRPPDALEVAMVERGRLPREVFGFWSSALPNINAVFGELCEVYAVVCTFPNANEQATESINQVYEHFRRDVAGDHFSVVEL